MNKFAEHLINGVWVESSNGRRAESTNPSTGEVLGHFADASLEDGARAIMAAKVCFFDTDWSHQPRIRSQVLLTFAERLERERERIAFLLSSENGKPIGEAMHEVSAAISEARYYAGLARNIFGRITEVDTGQFCMLAREPMGVAGIIVPWNAPATLLIRSLAPAIAAGCTSVVKAAPQSALVNAAIFKLFNDIPGLPAGAINTLSETGSEVSRLLVASPDVDVISYTGSTEVGKQIMAGGASGLKRMNLELGGSAPCVVLPDADLDLTAAGIVRAGLAHTGQVCVAASRIIAHESVIDSLEKKVVDALSGVAMGPATDPSTSMGPLIDNRSCERISALEAQAMAVGDVVLAGSKPGGALANGCFRTPALVRIEDSNTTFLQQEIFGPLLSIYRFADSDEAIAKANDTDFGLAASVWTTDRARGMQIAQKIQAGTVWINAHMKLHAEIETGGYKQSGLGRLHGVEGLDEFMQTKNVSWFD